MIECGKHFDGCQVALADEFTGDGYVLGFWNEKDNPKIKEAFYLMEQDEFFGCYVDDRDGFDKAWDAGEYEPEGSAHFEKSEVEIISIPLGKDWTDLTRCCR